MFRDATWSCQLVLMFASLIAAGACSGETAKVNRPPSVPGQEAVTDEDVPIDIRVLDRARDPDGDPLSVVAVDAGDHTVEVIDRAVLRFTPAPNFHGTATVSYQVSDGHLPVTGSLTITVRPVNDPPVASDATRDVHGATPITLVASDVDGDVLTYTVVTQPAHGTLKGTPPDLQYTPDTAFLGDDAITYIVSDGVAEPRAATLHLHVTAGSAPVAQAATRTGNEDQTLDLALAASDADRDPLTYTIVTQPAHGTLSGTAPDLIYTPAQDYFGNDSLQFQVSDPYLTSNLATIAIHILPVNDAPVAAAQSVDIDEDTGVGITLQGSDVEGDSLTFRIQTSPAHGTLSAVSGSTLTYTPAANFNGSDSFAFVASDATLSSAPATVTIHVAPVNDPPVATSFTVPLNEDTTKAIALVGTDVDGDALSYTVASQPAHGTLSGTPPNLSYAPAANYNGPDSFTYTVSDGSVTSGPGTVTLQVNPVDDAPVPTSATVMTAEDSPVSFTLQATDVDDTALSFSVVTPPSDGTLTGTPPNLTYTPASNANGTRSLTFRVSDGQLAANGTITLQIMPVNDPPVAHDDFRATDAGTVLTTDVTINDTDIDGDPLTLVSVGAPGHGAAVVVAGKLVYTPDPGFTGVDVFSYTIADPSQATATANVHIGVGTYPTDAPQETLVSGAVQTFDNSNAPSISGDGRYIAFTTTLGLAPGDTNALTDVYLFDRGTRTVTLVSAPPGGGASNGLSARTQVSADGHYVVFQSTANNLVAGDSNGQVDVFRYDRLTGEIVRVSVATGGGQASGASIFPQISSDGNLVAFSSTAFDLVANDVNGASDIFVRNIAAGTTERVSVSLTGADGDLASTEPALSGDGRFVAFSSLSTNLVSGDGNNASDAFVRDRVAGTTARVSVSSTGGEANGACTGPALSGDGRFASFVSNATNLVSGVTTTGQLYVHDLQGLTTTRPLASLLVTWGRLSGDGRYLVQLTSNGVAIRDRFAAITATPAGAAAWLWPAIAAGGRYIAVLTTGGAFIVTPNPL
jgi:hypothetical protein